MQSSGLRRLRTTGTPRTVLAVALACWAVGALVFAVLPEDSDARSLAAVGMSWTAAIFAGLSITGALARAENPERTFWILLGIGVAFRFAGDVLWAVSRVFGVGLETPGLMPQDLAYAVSYPAFFAALLRLLLLTTRRIVPVVALDALGVMLSVGMLIWYFVLGPVARAADLTDWREILVTLSQPVCDAALLFLGLVALSTVGRPRYVELLGAGFIAFLIADTWYLKLRSAGPYESGNWPEPFWALGLVLLGLAALRAAPTGPTGRWIEPWWVFAFWLGPLSPPIQFGFILAWGATHPPLPSYVSVGGVVLLLYMALRFAVVSFVNRRLRKEQEEAAKASEQSRVLYEMHDTVKQGVHGISLILRAALDAERRGERDAAREALGRALEASREAEFRITKPYDEIQIIHEEGKPSPGAYLHHRLARFEQYFGIKTHADFQAPLEVLSPAEIAAAQRVFDEASWNVAKHSGARNLWLETRRVGSVFIVRTRDDGRGLDPAEPRPGLGLRYMRRRAQEVGAELDVISAPGRGTTVQLRFDKG